MGCGFVPPLGWGIKLRSVGEVKGDEDWAAVGACDGRGEAAASRLALMSTDGSAEVGGGGTAAGTLAGCAEREPWKSRIGTYPGHVKAPSKWRTRN